MTLIDSIKILETKLYEDFEGKNKKVKLKKGLSDEQLDLFIKKLPNQIIPQPVKELLKYTSGIKGSDIRDEVKFDAIGEFGLEELFPNSIPLTGDGMGNFFVLDILSNGNWGKVFYTSHDPAVIIKVADNLEQFIEQLIEFYQDQGNSFFATVQNNIMYGKKNDGFKERSEIKLNGGIEEFLDNIGYDFVIVDLRETENGKGFFWGKFDASAQFNRYKDEYLRTMEKKKSIRKKIIARFS